MSCNALCIGDFDFRESEGHSCIRFDLQRGYFYMERKRVVVELKRDGQTSGVGCN